MQEVAQYSKFRTPVVPAFTDAVHTHASFSRSVLHYLVKQIDILFIKLVEVILLVVFSTTVLNGDRGRL